MKHLHLLFICFYSATLLAQPRNTEQLKQDYNRQLAKQTTAVFEENKGQMKDQYWKPRPDVLYYGKGEGMNYYIRNNGMSYQLSRVESWKEEDDRIKTPALEGKAKRKLPDQIGTFRVDAEWQNYNKDFTIEKGKALEGYNNYYNVPDGVEPALFVKQYETVTLKNLWNGVDVHYYSTDGHLETDYLVAPGADYKQIQIAIKGAELSTDNEGHLIMKTPFGEIREGALKVYQNNEPLKAIWKIITGKNEALVSFEIPKYNPTVALRIDPLTRIWGTYYGGSDFDGGLSCTTDGSGNIYISGLTQSTTNIASGGHQNTFGGTAGTKQGVPYSCFLVKFNSNGGRQWGTYYEGDGQSCTTDGSGNVYLAGGTQATTAVATGGHQNTFGGGFQDAFLVKFNTSGIRQWGTYYGGTGDDGAHSACTDASGNVYLAGYTYSSNAIASGGFQNAIGGTSSGDAFLVKFNASGIRQWGTYYGGTGDDGAHSACTDASGNVYLAGYTGSTTAIASGGHQNTLSGTYDAFLVKFNTSGVRQWGTYYGGSGEDRGYSCASDGNGNVYLAGFNESTNGIASGGFQNTIGGSVDAFLVKFNTSGLRQWGTYYGGSGWDDGNSCTTDGSGNVYLVGNTNSTNAIASGGHQNTYGGGNNDAFLIKFNPSGARQWGTYYGGTGDDLGNSVARDGSGNIFLSGYSTSTNGIASGGFQNIIGGTEDAFLVKFGEASCIANISGNSGLCSGESTTLTASAGSSYLWSNGSSSSSITVSPTQSVTYSVTITDAGNCTASASSAVTVTAKPIPQISSNSPVSYKGTILLTSNLVSNATYSWTGPNGFTSNQQNPSIPDVNDNNRGVYTLVITVNGCASNPATVYVHVNSVVLGMVYKDQNLNCVRNTGEQGVANIPLMIQPGNNITYTDVNGEWYAEALPAGGYTIAIDTAKYNWLINCSPVRAFQVPHPDSSVIGPDFGMVFKNCSKPEVSITMPRMRRGFGGQPIYVKACNRNTALDNLNNGYVEIKLPSRITIQSGSLSYTNLGGNKYRVNVGTLSPGQCVNFTLNATVSSSAVRNQTLCLSAELFPQADCVFDSVPKSYPPNTVSPCNTPYDNSNLKTDVTCEQDSVRLVVRNSAPRGGGDMSCFSPVRIFLDGKLVRMDSVRLQGGDSVVYRFPGSSKTWMIQAAQHPLNFRGDPRPTATLELCGTGNWTPGLVNALPQSDPRPVIGKFCGQVSAPYDPNDKTGFPLGVDTTHAIERNEDIEYLIRFQNIGTDTAVNVVILDTLSTDLDIFSLRSGVSSHPYEFRMYGPRVLEWRFDNIMLPDSNVNEPASNGFVWFKVKQNKDLPYGTVIKNTAAIYFDFEDPVITNTYFHTVTEPFPLVSSIVTPDAETNLRMKVIPNPFSNTATVKVDGAEPNSDMSWELYNIFGQQVKTEKLNGSNRFELNREALPAGIYLLQLKQQQRVIGYAKVVVE